MPMVRLSQTSGFQNLKPACSASGLGDEHRFGVAEQVEMRVAPEHAVGFGEQLAEARVREDPEPVVARGLAVLEPRRRADGAVLLERFVGRIRDQQIDRFRGLVLQPAHGVQV
jgi:hypothetical protein